VQSLKICFFSDIHGNGYAFKAFREQMQIEKNNPDIIVFGGDVFGYYYDVDEILTYLRNSNFICLLGNHDRMFLDLLDGKIDENYLIHRYGNSYLNIVSNISGDNISFLRKLPVSYEFTTEKGKTLGFFHGGPDNPLEMRIYPDTVILDTTNFDKYDYVFCGHTHHKIEKHIGNCTVINPGSAGQQRDGKGTAYCLYDTKKDIFSINVFTYDVKLLIEEIKKRETDEKMKERLIEVLLRSKIQ